MTARLLKQCASFVSSSRSRGVYLHVELIVTLGDLHQLLLNELAGALGGLQPAAHLLDFGLHQAEAPLLQAVLLPQLLVLTGVLVHLHLHVLQAAARGRASQPHNYYHTGSLDQLAVVPVGVVQLDLHLVQVRLHLFLQTQGLGTALGLCLQTSLQGLYGALLRHSFWEVSSSSCSSSHFWLHSAIVLSKIRCFLSSAAAAALDYRKEEPYLSLTFSRLAALAWAASAASSASWSLAASLRLCGGNMINCAVYDITTDTDPLQHTVAGQLVKDELLLLSRSEERHGVDVIPALSFVRARHDGLVVPDHGNQNNRKTLVLKKANPSHRLVFSIKTPAKQKHQPKQQTKDAHLISPQTGADAIS
ncbi:hypothetical protein JZ751_015232 [Albula glossodonta]|uniref:Uncharacterized protein n=1 Tax=Albula glossodonta TaxID=121402 RepID=A0A8T2NS90_9TELE|nr:hypothetical protein JZ751_015232 [Albula glossodonta]